MHSLHLAGRSFDSPAAVISGLLGVQAENHAQAGWAVAARTKTLTEEEFGKAFDNGQLLRTHVLRPTWHFVLPDDIRWLLDLTGPRIKRTMKSFARQLGLDDHDLGRSADLLAEALSDGDHLTRSDLRESLERGEVTTDGPRLSLLLMNAELSSVMCSGRMQGKRHTYARLEDRAPDARRLDREEALAELVFRYVRGHGPASERDITYWATLTLTDVRAGLAAVAHRLDRFEHDGREFWFVPPRPPEHDVVPRAHLLQVLDEYHHGYQDSRYVLDMDELGPRGRPAIA